MRILASHWHELYRHRLNWAERAYEEFLQGIGPELARYFSQQGKEASVVLFGKTQVGKTTLLLKIMGVRHEVAGVLRGRQSLGKSATATAVRYSESPDDFWRLRDDLDSEQLLSDAEFEEKLCRLRSRVEEGSYFSDRPVEIKIPGRYFETRNKRILKINILDLPGEHPRNEWEAAHVKRVAGKYVPVADLILLIGRGDDLSFLKPSALSIPEIDDWRYVPDKFRIITTFSTKAESFVEWLGSQEHPSSRDFRHRLMQQIATHDYLLPDDVKQEYLFPLEYGDSWVAMEKQDPALFGKVKPVVDGMFEELIETICDSATPHARIMSAAKLYIVAEKHKLTRKAVFEEYLAETQQEQNKLNSMINSFQIQKNCLDKRLKQLRCESVVSEEYLKKIIHNQLRIDPTKNISKKDWDLLYEYLTEFTEVIKSKLDELVLQLYEIDMDISAFRSSASKIIIEHTDSAREVLNRRSIIEKLFGYGFEDDKSICIRAIVEVIHDLRNKCENECLRLRQQNLAEINKNIELTDSEIVNLDKSISRTRLKLEDNINDIDKIKSQYVSFLKDIEQSIANGKIFRERLSDCFMDQLVSTKMSLKEEKDQVLRFFLVIFSVLLIREKEKLFSTQ